MYQLRRSVMKIGAWNIYRGVYCVQPAPRQKVAPMTRNSRNPAIHPVNSPPNHLASNEIVTNNEYEQNFHEQKFSLNLYFRMDHVTRNALVARNNEAYGLGNCFIIFQRNDWRL